MVELSQNDKELLSFPDSKVLKMEIDLINKTLEIQTDFCWVESCENLEDNCRIILKNWKKFEVYKHDLSINQIVQLTEDEVDCLDEIPVYVYEHDNVLLEGCGVKSKAWMIYKFYNVEVEGTYGELIRG